MTDMGIALGDALRDFVGEVQKPSGHQPGQPFFTVMRQAIIKAVGAWSGSTPTVSIAFPEDPPGTSIPDVKVLHPYVPQVGDTVWAARMGPDLLVVSKMRGASDYVAAGDPHQSPDLAFSARGANAGYNFYEQGNNARRWGWQASSGKARLQMNGSVDHLQVDSTGAVTVPAGLLTASQGATVQSGATVSGGATVNGGGTIKGGFELDDAGVVDSSAVRMFASAGTAFVQAGSGRGIQFRDQNASLSASINTNQDWLGVGVANPGYAVEAGGDVYASGAHRGGAGGQGGTVMCRTTANVFSTKWDGSSGLLHFFIDNQDVAIIAQGATVNPGTKSFVIEHPTKKDRYLVHGCVEGPEAAVFYRGTERTKRGRKVVRLPAYFEKLVREEGRTVQLTQALDDEDDDLATLGASAVKDGKFVVRSSIPEATFHWEVTAVRADVDVLEVEPTVGEKMLAAMGPYAYLTDWPDLHAPPTLAEWAWIMRAMNPTIDLPETEADLLPLYDAVRHRHFKRTKWTEEWETFWFPSMDDAEAATWRVIVDEQGIEAAEARRDSLFRAIATRRHQEAERDRIRAELLAAGWDFGEDFVVLGG